MKAGSSGEASSAARKAARSEGESLSKVTWMACCSRCTLWSRKAKLDGCSCHGSAGASSASLLAAGRWM